MSVKVCENNQNILYVVQRGSRIINR